MLNVKVEASLVITVYSTQIKPTAIRDKKDTLKVVSKMLNSFVIILFINCYRWYKYTLVFELHNKKVYLFVEIHKNLLKCINSTCI